MNSLLNLWDLAAVTTALAVIVVTAIGIMVGLIELDHAFKRIGWVLGFLVLLLAMPPIILGIWHSLTVGERLGIVAILGLLGAIILRRGASCAKKRSREH